MLRHCFLIYIDLCPLTMPTFRKHLERHRTDRIGWLRADKVAVQLMKQDALGAHARDELGISEAFSAKPIQAASASAASFAVGAALPLGVTWLASRLGSSTGVIPWVAGTSLVFLAVLGVIAARVGGTSSLMGAWRVTFWGALAMGITAGVGALFGATGAG